MQNLTMGQRPKKTKVGWWQSGDLDGGESVSALGKKSQIGAKQARGQLALKLNATYLPSSLEPNCELKTRSSKRIRLDTRNSSPMVLSRDQTRSPLRALPVHQFGTSSDHFFSVPNDNSICKCTALTLCQSLVYVFYYSNLLNLKTRRGRYYYLYITDEKIGTKRLSNLPKAPLLEATKLECEPIRICAQSCSAGFCKC